MALPTNCEEYFEQALAAPNGIAVELDTPGQAVHFMQKMNQFRVKTRKNSKEVYETDHPKWNKTPWDELSISQDKEDKSVVLIRRVQLAVKKVREL